MATSKTHSNGFAPERRTALGKLIHLFGFMTGFLVPAIVYFLSKDEFTRLNARNALNWQLLVLGVVFILALPIFGLGIVSDWPLLVAVALVITPLLGNLLACLWATTKAFRGDVGAYPVALGLL